MFKKKNQLIIELTDKMNKSIAEIESLQEDVKKMVGRCDELKSYNKVFDFLWEEYMKDFDKEFYWVAVKYTHTRVLKGDINYFLCRFNSKGYRSIELPWFEDIINDSNLRFHYKDGLLLKKYKGQTDLSHCRPYYVSWSEKKIVKCDAVSEEDMDSLVKIENRLPMRNA